MQFRTGWFMESVISASFIVLIIRTRRPFYRSRPGKYLVIATLFVGLLVILLPYSPIAGLLGFTHLPPVFLVALAFIVGAYVAMAEIAKSLFYRLVKY
jgi:Mg2+-importing ATPase